MCEKLHVRERTYSCLRWVKGGPGKYLIDRTALAYLHDVSGSGSSAARFAQREHYRFRPRPAFWGNEKVK